MLKRFNAALAVALSLLVGTSALAADNYTLKDAGTSGTNGTVRTLRATDVGSGVLVPRSTPADATGAAWFTSGNPAYVTFPSGQTLILGAGSATIGNVGIVGTVPLPTGAATAAKQPALGTAGSASADVLSVQGISGGTPIPVTGSFSATTAGTYNSTPPTMSNGASGPLQTDVNGNLKVVGSFSATTTGYATTAAPSYGNNTTQNLSLTPAGGLRVDGSGVTQPMSVASLPLPSGAAQDGSDPGSPPYANAGTGIRGWLATLTGRVEAVRALLAGTLTVTGPLTDTQLRAAAVPVSVSGGATAANQASEIAALGAPGDSAWASGNGTVVGVLKGIKGSIDSGAAASIPAGSNTIGNVVPVQPSSIATGQVSCGTTAAQAVAARSGRRNVVLIQEGTTLVRIGVSGVTTSTGVPLPGTAYSALTIDGGAAIYCITASGTQTISFVEAY